MDWNIPPILWGRSKEAIEIEELTEKVDNLRDTMHVYNSELEKEREETQFLKEKLKTTIDILCAIKYLSESDYTKEIQLVSEHISDLVKCKNMDMLLEVEGKIVKIYWETFMGRQVTTDTAG